MEILQEADKRLRPFLPPQKREAGVTYRLLQYILSQPVAEGALLYNTLTCMLVLVKNLHEEEEALIQNWMMVKENHDDFRMAQEVKQYLSLLRAQRQPVTGYTIMTTTDCNARCFYCYEKGRSRIPMSEKTALDTADFIIRNSQGKKVQLCWFGGEPLYNRKAIDRICERLHSSGIPFRSTIITNGYLIRESDMPVWQNTWKIHTVQITLDGAEATYNRTKAFVHADANPFQRVIRNIHTLTDHGIQVHLRLNIDHYNLCDMEQLVAFLAAEFQEKENLRVYARMLYEKAAGETLLSRSETEKERLQEKLNALEEELRKNGLMKPRELKKELKGHQCMADSGSSLVINPCGDLILCEHHSEDEIIGSIYSEKVDEPLVRSWKTCWPEQEECKRCAAFPDCYRLRKCTKEHCTLSDRKNRLKRLSDSMLLFYEKQK